MTPCIASKSTLVTKHQLLSCWMWFMWLRFSSKWSPMIKVKATLSWTMMETLLLISIPLDITKNWCWKHRKHCSIILKQLFATFQYIFSDIFYVSSMYSGLSNIKPECERRSQMHLFIEPRPNNCLALSATPFLVFYQTWMMWLWLSKIPAQYLKLILLIMLLVLI